MKIPLDRVNFMCKLVPMKGTISQKSLTGRDERKAGVQAASTTADSVTVRQWIDIAMKLEGMNRNVGTHAAGVVISDGPISDYVPVQRAKRKSGRQRERRQGRRQRRGRDHAVGNGHP